MLGDSAATLQKAGADPAEFHLVTKNRTWVFRAISKEDKRKWLDVLEACIKGAPLCRRLRRRGSCMACFRLVHV